MTSTEYERLLQLTPVQAAALTSFLEARDQPVLGIVGVIWTMRNRAQLRGGTWTRVCLAPYQYSCWNATDRQSALGLELGECLIAGHYLPERPDLIVLDTCRYLAGRIEANTVPDPVAGATHYHTMSIPPPIWAQPPAIVTATIGRHRFYKGVRPFVDRELEETH